MGFKEAVELELRNSLGLLNSLTRQRPIKSMVPEHEWADVVSQRIADKFKGRVCSLCKRSRRI